MELSPQEQTEGQKRKICFKWISDCQRYKVLGNAVTTKVITAIGNKLLT